MSTRLPATDMMTLYLTESADCYATARNAADTLERQLAVVLRRPRQYLDVDEAHVRYLISELRRLAR